MLNYKIGWQVRKEVNGGSSPGMRFFRTIILQDGAEGAKICLPVPPTQPMVAGLFASLVVMAGVGNLISFRIPLQTAFTNQLVSRKHKKTVW